MRSCGNGNATRLSPWPSLVSAVSSPSTTGSIGSSRTSPGQEAPGLREDSKAHADLALLGMRGVRAQLDLVHERGDPNIRDDPGEALGDDAAHAETTPPRLLRSTSACHASTCRPWPALGQGTMVEVGVGVGVELRLIDDVAVGQAAPLELGRDEDLIAQHEARPSDPLAAPRSRS